MGGWQTRAMALQISGAMAAHDISQIHQEESGGV
jgi:hypothetical protein